ncbi:MAG: 2-C-methyl-D-erythritol 4-phosphate cytidylyltransferase [Bacteroidetes bacterium]|nr:2-C-methyl-D-erythritol 4-phosphate cytidylyltransferase [Bacteroidota bacterium]MBU1680279.1 2-C-methyl-D-erythritol 4-phosphate cytidylyltransferase [Bacteroidota bacterium]
MKVTAVIPSGGIGKRINSSLPKQYIQIKGKELIAYTLQIFNASIHVDEIVIAAAPEYFELLSDIKSKYGFNKIIKVVSGGKERQDSVYNALSSISAHSEDLIVVHDAARPILPASVLENAIATAKKHGAVVSAIKASDTLLKGNQTVESYLDRNDIYYVQTPQVFKFGLLHEAMKKANLENFIGTDESMLVHNYGHKVVIVDGSPINIKVTNNEDLEIIKLLL